jgi:CrcB protein
MDDDQVPRAHRPETPTGGALERPAVPRLRLSTTTLLAVFVGGAAGTVARYLLDAHHAVPQGNFPWVTLVINLSGSLAIGVLVPLTEQVAPRAPWARPLLVVGFLGGWTTYSTLAVEATLLAKDGDIVTFVAYVAATVFGGLALVVLGDWLGRRMVRE